MALTPSQRRYIRLLFYLFGAAIILVFFPIRLTPVTPRERLREARARGLGDLGSIRNGTLGFQKVLSVSLPSREDKRDNIILGSSISDFHVEFVDGLTPDEISPRAVPYNWNYDLKPNEYASRRAHLNALRRVVGERLGSALIMEDDADWDVSIKTQLQSFAIAARALQGTRGPPSSPYGDDWDILWLGHCGLECKANSSFFLIPNDPTIPPPRHFLPYWRDPPPIDRPDHARLICTIGDAVCSITYAVSFHGAQRLLSALSVHPAEIAEKIDIGAQFDVSLGRMCGGGYLRCLAAYPALTGGYTPAGPSDKGSDLHEGAMEGEIQGAWSYGVMYSTMLNVHRLLRGEKTVHANWDDVEVLDVDPNDIPVLDGVLEDRS